VLGVIAFATAEAALAGVVLGVLMATKLVLSPPGIILAVVMAAILMFWTMTAYVLNAKYSRCPGKGIWWDITFKRDLDSYPIAYPSGIGCRT